MLYDQDALVALMRERYKGKLQAEIGVELGLTESAVYMILSGNRNISARTAHKLGFRRVIRFERSK